MGFLAATALLLGASGDGIAPRIIGVALSDGRAAALAQSLSDDVGSRPTGSAGAAKAVQWAVAQMKTLGLKNVHTEPVKVPRWVRGEAAAELVLPTSQRVDLVALGPSVATPPEGLTADVVAVRSFDELKALGDGAKGKIVLFLHDMKRSHGFEEYARAVGLRHGGAIEAGRAGAVAMLVRSAGSGAYRLAHTGGVAYDGAVPKIPAAAVTVEDADLMERLLKGGQRVRLKLKLTSHSEAEVESANVVGEVPGREHPEQVVLLGAHLDSWDLATGALDDAAGCAIALDAARTIAASGRPPRRTVRVVLFMNEEMGLSGGKAYAARHAAELGKHVAALETDSGDGRILGFGASSAAGLALLRKLTPPLRTLGAAEVRDNGEAGSDLRPMGGKVPLVSAIQDMERYFDWHHTAADTFDKIEPLNLAIDTAAVAVVAYGLADAAEVMPPGRF